MLERALRRADRRIPMSTENRSARLICAAKGLQQAVGVPVYVYYELHRPL